LKNAIGPQAVCFALALLAAGCGRNDTLGSRFVKSQRVSAASGATLVVSRDESPELAGARLDIPPGALASDLTITLDLKLAAIAPGGQAAGPVAVFGPAGTSLAVAARLTLPFKLEDGQHLEHLAVRAADDRGHHADVGHAELEVDDQGGTVTLSVRALGEFEAEAHQACAVDSDCPGGLVCSSGECEDRQETDGGTPYYCTADSDCPAGFSCQHGECEVAGTDDHGGADGGGGNGDGGGGGCGGGYWSRCGRGGPCTADTDCATGLVCLAGQCEDAPGADGGSGKPCTTTSDCSHSQTCTNGRCQ
jgi:Cys-rich repeat protein